MNINKINYKKLGDSDKNIATKILQDLTNAKNGK